MQAAPPTDRAGTTASVLRSKPVLAVLTLLAVAAIPELVPVLARYRLLSPRPVVSAAPAAIPPPETALGETELPSTGESRPDLAQPEKLEERLERRGPIADDGETAPQHGATDTSPVAVVDESRSLARFYAALSRTEKREKGAISRVVFFGDSVVASDFGTGTLRRLLQKRFGDAGHGFVLAASAWPQYFHNDVYRYADKGFRASRVVGPRASDGLYGLGGVSFVGAPGLRSRVGTSKSGSYGRRVSRFELAYVEEPGGGLLELLLDGAARPPIDTNGPEKRVAFAEIRTEDGEHELELKTARANVRLFGMVLERDEPGVVLDAIGLVGARLRTLDESDDDDFARALAWRKPNLVAYQFGANESGDGFAYPMPEYHRTMKELLQKVQRAVPDAACLVVGAMDRARKEDGHLVTLPIIPILVEEQRRVAAEVGCAYYATYDAMGGRGSMGAWVRKGFGAGDFTHPTSWGADQLGRWLYSALMTGYDARGGGR
ncbi:MAG TPA: hypothetical protein VHE30_08525 [Polyangiaceae bacterium]|nr:hypothetical protein [Polyangiaceae bacterium]